MNEKSPLKRPGAASLSGSCGVGFVCNLNSEQSHEIIRQGIEAVKNLTHRGAVGADGKTGDGAGVLFQIPKAFFLDELRRLGFTMSHIDNLAIGFFFLHGEKEHDIEAAVQRFQMKPIGWRDVPSNDDALGEAALSIKPKITQLLIDRGAIPPEKRELHLFLARKRIEKTLGNEVYVVSLSSKTIIYKGMLIGDRDG